MIVPARDAEATIGRTLAKMAAQDLTAQYEVIVVDDGSADATAEIASRAGARVLRQPGRGPGQARNLGAREARAGALAFTDADCFPAPGWLRQGMVALRDADLVQGQVLPDPNALRRPFDHTIWVTRESGLYETANLFVRRDLYLDVGGFEDWLDVRMGKRLGEDVWFGWKARRRGARTRYCEEALVHHAVFPRRWWQFVAERRRLLYFPALVRKVPELRRHFLTARLFVTPRSALFDLALGGTAAAAFLARRRRRAAILGLLCTVPYASLLVRRVAGDRRFGPRVAAVEVVADLVGCLALLLGSARRRTPVL